MAKKLRLSIDRTVSELVSNVDLKEVAVGFASRSPWMYADYLADVLRDAILRSSMHGYNGTVYCFDGIKYSPVDTHSFSNITYSALKQIGLPDGNLRKKWYIDNILKAAALEKALEPDPGVVTFTNCVFDMDGEVMHKFSPKRISVTQMDYAYDPEAQCTLWLRFLDEVLPDKGMQRILQEFLGCVFIDRKRAKIEKMMVLLGPGANGKSVVHDVVRQLLGEENVTSFGIAELTGGYELKKNITTINGKRLNYASEISASTFTHVNDQLKKLISGEPMSARANYKDNFMATDIPLIMANANKLPGMSKDDLKAMSRRFIILPFNVEIPVNRQNPLLARELCEELPGIFNWVMQGRERYISNGFSFSEIKKIDETPAHFKLEGSTVVEFMLDRDYNAKRRETYEQPKWVKSVDLYREYNEWCLMKGKPSDAIENNISFGRKLTMELGYRKKSVRGGTAYGIYSDKVKMEYVSASDLTEDRVNKEHKRFLDVSGKKWIKTREALARELKVNLGIVKECIANGVFEGFIRQDGNAKIYDIDNCRIAMSLYLKEKGEAKADDAPTDADKKIWAMRGKFNKKMEKLGEPYRKYGAKTVRDNPENLGFTLVPDDWDYNTEIPVEMQATGIKRRRNTLKEINLEMLGNE